MIIERFENEILIRIPSTINIDYLQQIIDYLTVKSINEKSQANEDEIIKLSDDINKAWWNKNKNKKKFIK